MLGKKYHRVFIKQGHLTFDNVTDQVKLIEARLLKMLFKRAPQPPIGKEDGKEQNKIKCLGWPCSPQHCPSLVQRESLPPPIDLEGHQ